MKKLQIPSTARTAAGRIMNLRIYSALIASAVLVAPAVLVSGANTEPGFQRIFNGKDLIGWEGHPKLWFVKDGAITGQTTRENPAPHNTFLIWTNSSVGDFELRFSYKIVANNDKSFGDSGVQYRSKRLPDFIVTGYQANLMVTKPLTGVLYEEKGRGIVHQLGQKIVMKTDSENTNKWKVEVVGSFGDSADIQAGFKEDDWNDYIIIAKGNHLQHFINGRQTADVTDEDAPRAAASGIVALQLHAGLPMTVQFRNIRMKTLGAEDQSSAQAITKLQGVWQATAAEQDGSSLPSENITSILVTIKGSSYEVVLSDRTDRGTFTVDPSKQPAQMDIHPGTGQAEGLTLPAIYEVGPDSLRVCYARGDATRPTSFATTDDSRLLLIIYKRKQ